MKNEKIIYLVLIISMTFYWAKIYGQEENAVEETATEAIDAFEESATEGMSEIETNEENETDEFAELSELELTRQELETLRSELEVIEAREQNSIAKQTVQLSKDIESTTIKLYDLPLELAPDNEDEFDLNVLKNRKFSNNSIIEGYRNNIKELVGSVIELNEKDEIIDVGEFNFVKDLDKIKLTTPKNEIFIDKTYSKTVNTDAGWLFFGYTLDESELIRFSIEDVSSAQLMKDALNYEYLHGTYKVTDDNIDNLYIIRTINVSEILSRKYKHEKWNLKISEVPLGGTIFKAASNYYVSVSDLKRDFIIGLGYSKLKSILTQSAFSLKE